MFKISRTTLYRHMEKNNIHKNSKLTDKEIAILKQSIKPTLTLGHESCMSKEDHEQILTEYKNELQFKFEQMNDQIVELEEQLSSYIKQNEKLIADGVTKIEYIIKTLEANNQEVEVSEPIETTEQEVEVSEPIETTEQEVEVSEPIETTEQEVEAPEVTTNIEDVPEQSVNEEQDIPEKTVTKKKRWWKR